MNEILAKEKKIDTIYKSLENIYKYLFEVLLLQKIDLKKYDEEIKNSNLYFGKPNPTDNQLISGLKEYLNLDYIYLMNNFFIEKLDNKDIDILKSTYATGKVVATKEALSMVQRTYKEVIKEDYINGETITEPVKINYGVAIPKNFVDNDAIVLKIFYSKNTKELSDDVFLDNMEKQINLIKSIIEKIKTEVKEKLGVNCEVLEDKIVN